MTSLSKRKIIEAYQSIPNKSFYNHGKDKQTLPII